MATRTGSSDGEKSGRRPEAGKPGAVSAGTRERPPQKGEQGSRPRPSLRGVDAMPARERAYHELKFRILEGRLPPGTSLLEAEVASLLSMSRTPVREALIKLEEEGLVEVRPRHGITVRAQTIEEIAEIYEVFSTLEVKAAQLAARRGLTAEDAARLDQLMTRMELATGRDDIDHWSHLDDQFHSEIVALCGNARLQATLRQYWDQQYRARMSITGLRPKPTQSDIEHRRIVEAILARNEAEALRLHQEHRDRTDRQLLALLEGAAGRMPGRP
ncbi:GntR family transcriptional regulator [Fulvimarina endophytica]|uniref:GntR family transcriptional regulator n=1 Tax=Fulvimarina endophytica TaxID=2293836 RepID=A0A371X2F1_9HYPH|nr:GntR family transcriptional regulator [Fulvimarina endophytica]RFC63400.1 GntR family transcriptional regulator [Fulvimarina endophytica]